MAYFFEPGIRLNLSPAVAGDLIIGRSDGNFDRLAIGANGTFLNVSAGAIRWGNTIDTGGLTISAGNVTVSAGTVTITDSVGNPTLQITPTAAAFASTALYIPASRAASAAFDFAGFYAAAVAQFRVTGQGSVVSLGSITHNDALIIHTTTSFTNNAGVGAGTLTNAPAAGNPTKWIPIDDNGVTRNIPAW